MPIDTMFVTGVIVIIFTAFAIVLAWADSQTRRPR